MHEFGVLRASLTLQVKIAGLQNSMTEVTQGTTATTSRDLLSLVRRRNGEGWREFVNLYGPLVYGWCRQAGLAPSDAADITQEVFASVFTAIDDFRRDQPGDTLRGWLRVICRNKLLDFLSLRSKNQQAAGGTEARLLLADIAAKEHDDESSVVSERRMLVHRAAEMVRHEFPDKTWRAFWLTTVEQKSAPEAATALNISAGAVRQAKYMALRRLRQELAGEVEPANDAL